MNLLSIIKDIFKPAAKLVDSLHTSAEEKGKVQAEIDRIAAEVTKQALELQSKMLDAQTKVVTAEIQGESWLQRMWRPITMMTFLILVVADSLGWLPNRLAEPAWDVLLIGIGGYVVGRSGEKAIDKWKGK